MKLIKVLLSDHEPHHLVVVAIIGDIAYHVSAPCDDIMDLPLAVARIVACAEDMAEKLAQPQHAAPHTLH